MKLEKTSETIMNAEIKISYIDSIGSYTRGFKPIWVLSYRVGEGGIGSENFNTREEAFNNIQQLIQEEYNRQTK